MTSELFAPALEAPDPDLADRFGGLIGLDDVKQHLVAEAAALLNPRLLEEWARRHHHTGIAALMSLRGRIPLIVLAGDVGTGKTELAESVGDPIARRLSVDVTVYRLSLSSRGTGLVGQMTTLITQALAEIADQARKARRDDGEYARAIVLVIDEADTIAQSRELQHMHHEDRAGVNALIQGIDNFRETRLPVVTIMCTNRPDAIDPAVARRASRVFMLRRPSRAQCIEYLTGELGDIVSAEAICAAADGLVPNEGHGATWSDLRQRFVPQLVIDAYQADEPLTDRRVAVAANTFVSTRPFAGEAA